MDRSLNLARISKRTPNNLYRYWIEFDPTKFNLDRLFIYITPQLPRGVHTRSCMCAMLKSESISSEVA